MNRALLAFAAVAFLASIPYYAAGQSWNGGVAIVIGAWVLAFAIADGIGEREE